MRFPNAAMGIVALCILVVLPVRAQNATEAIKVVGIVDLPNYRRALIERTNSYRGRETSILQQGEREGELEVVNISPEERAVKINMPGIEGERELVLRIGGAPVVESQRIAKKSLVLNEVGLHPMLSLLGGFTGKTLLCHPRLTVQRFSFSAGPADRNEAVTVLEKTLAEREIVCVKDGQKFIMIVPKSEEANVHPASPDLTLPAQGDGSKTSPAENKKSEVEMIQPGVIDFRATDLVNVAMFYAALTDGKPDLENLQTVRGDPIILRTQTALTREEAKYALDTLFAWQGFKAVRSSDGTVQLQKIETK